MSDRTAARKASKRESVLWAIPIVAGLAGLLIGFVVANARPDRFEHVVTLVSANDGRVGVRDNRDLAFEFLRAELSNNPPAAGVEAELESRLGSVLDIIVTAPTPEQAATVAETLADVVVDGVGKPWLASIEAGISANESAVATLNGEIAQIESDIASLALEDFTGSGRLERDRNSLAEIRNQLNRTIVSAQTQIDGASPPITVSLSVAGGNTAEARRIAGLAGAAAAILALFVVSAAPARRR